MDIIKKLENWHTAKKGRYVKGISIDTTYGATCWEVVLGNVNIKPKEGWFNESDRAEVYVTETSFISGDMPQNCAVVVDGDEMKSWPGLVATIELAIELANKLGL